ncbi:MAG: PEP-CTERM sorting domain-containing protein [Phycisphaerae bacterium]
MIRPSASGYGSVGRQGLIALSVLGTFLLAPLARADLVRDGYLYVSDYGLSQMERYKYTYNKTTNTITKVIPFGIGSNTTNAYFLGGGPNPVKEGVHGTLTDLILVGGNHGTGVTNITRYTLGGTLIGSIPIDFSPYNGGNVGIGNTLVTSDGKYLYAPLESGNAVVKVDLSNGAIVHSYAFTGAHDLAIAKNGDVYVADYNSGTRKVIRLDSNLTYLQDLVTSANFGGTGTFRPSGLSIAADGSLFVQNNDNTAAGYDSVLHYKLTGSTTLTATLDAATSYIGSATNNALNFTFGSNLGPDGKLYIATLGGGGSGSFNITSSYVDGIYTFDPVTQSITQFIAGYKEKTGPVGASGLSAPKYLQFDINFSPAFDIGYIPEPASLLLLGVGGIPVLFRRRSRR